MATVLTVENHAASRDHLSSLLRYAGHDVLEAADGPEGLDLAHDAHPDLVIADLLMPTMDGVEFVRRLREDPDNGATPVLFFTASYRVPETETLARRSGVSGVLPKTAGDEDLLRTIGAVLGYGLERAGAERLPVERDTTLSERLAHTRGELDRVSQRLAAILDASNELLAIDDPTDLLQRMGEVVREIVGSRYAVVLVPTTDGSPPRRFVAGLKADPALAALPTSGPLARVLEGGQALRLEMVDGPDAVGLPAGHPGLSTLLAARLTGAHGPIGLVFCADKVANERFVEEDEYLLVSLATQVATAYEKARLRDELQKRAAELAEEMANRKKAEERLLHAQKMDSIGKLAGGISHDFNNLLTVIKGYGEILMAQVSRGDPLYDPTREILGAADRAASLVRQLLAFSRKQVLAPTLLDLNSAVTSMDRLLKRLIGEEIELVTFPGPALGLIRADASQLEQVIVNLAVNARDAMPSGGKLTVELANAELDLRQATEIGATPGAYVRLAVTDTGVGMDAEVLRQLFEPFFTTKAPGKGTGLGLATVYGIVKQSGGAITVYSEVGHGSTFKIYLPRANESVLPGEASQVAAGAGGSETVLLVEDESAVRRLAKQMLKQGGYTVLEAANGADALRLADEHPGPIHLVVTDLVMPGMGGHQMMGRLRAKRPDVQTLFMSGYAGNAVLEGGALDASGAFIEKPFTPISFLAKVREVLDRGREQERASR